ncbi:MAG: nucleotidyltransferase domain-containing protein [Desulfobacteraceae bacterium]|nr:nucleotidyltransferase domain-containing protein [Desulfobacteraceae bacterium]
MIQNDRVLDIFVTQLKNGLGDNLRKIILFGYRARKDDRPESDYDCMAVVKNISPKLNDVIDEIAAEFLYEYNAVFSVFPVSETRYDTEICNPLFMNVKKEGITL